MAVTCQQARTDITMYITKCGGNPKDWYVGIAADPRSRLFDEHQVDENKGSWIYRTLDSDGDARSVERHFHERGYQGAGGGGDDDTCGVYAYRITSQTKE